MKAIPANQDFPALTGRVVDGADLLSPEEEDLLSNKSEALERATGHQLVVVTVPDLKGKPILYYGVDLGRHWGIGRKCVDDGVLLIVAPKERQTRIEVGNGLEKALRDEEAAEILRDNVLPAFKAGDFPSGIELGVDEIIREIGPGVNA